MDIEDYRNSQPQFELNEYFLGNVRAWGIFQERGGLVKRQFTVDIVGKVENEELILEEDFNFRDGEQSRRVWRIRKLDEHHYEGRADDVVGIAKGISYGNALHWKYDLNLNVGERTLKVHFDDWMPLQEDGVLLNRATMSKISESAGSLQSPSWDAFDVKLVLKGEGTLCYGWLIDVYTARLWGPKDVPSEAMLEMHVPKRLEILYYRPIEKDVFSKAANHVLEKQLPPEEFHNTRAKLDQFHDTYQGKFMNDTTRLFSMVKVSKTAIFQDHQCAFRLAATRA